MMQKSFTGNKVLKFVLFLLILITCWYLGRVFKFDVAYYQAFLSKYPVTLSGLIFVILYVGTTTFIWFGPKDVLRISSAILFGATVSTIFVWIGEMINALIMFQLSRVLGREYVQQRFRLKSKDIDKVKDDASFLGILALRINPLIPFRLMDLTYGLTRVSFRKYFIAIFAVSFFRIFWLQFILAGIGANIFQDVSVMMDYFFKNPRVIQYSTLYFLIVIGLSTAAMIMRSIRKRKNAVV